jgi:hypothetical protein
MKRSGKRLGVTGEKVSYEMDKLEPIKSRNPPLPAELRTSHWVGNLSETLAIFHLGLTEVANFRSW